MDNVKVEELKNNNEFELVRKTNKAIIELKLSELQDIAKRLAEGIDDVDVNVARENLLYLVASTNKLKKFCDQLEKEYKGVFYSLMEAMTSTGENIPEVYGCKISVTCQEEWDFSGNDEWNKLQQKLADAKKVVADVNSEISNYEELLKAQYRVNPIENNYYLGNYFKSAAVKVK